MLLSRNCCSSQCRYLPRSVPPADLRARCGGGGVFRPRESYLDRVLRPCTRLLSSSWIQSRKSFKYSASAVSSFLHFISNLICILAALAFAWLEHHRQSIPHRRNLPPRDSSRLVVTVVVPLPHKNEYPPRLSFVHLNLYASSI